MPQPKKAPQNLKSRHIIFRVTERKYAKLEQQAIRIGLTVNQLACRRVCDSKPEVVIKTHKRFDPAFIKRLERIGQNLNQLVKNAHIFKRVSPQVEKLCYKIERIISDVIDSEVDE